MEYINSKPVLASKVEKEFFKLKEEKELQYNENIMAEHYESYSLSESSIKKMKSELKEIVEDEEVIVKICDVIPIQKETIKMLMLSFDDEINEEIVEKIHNIIKKYVE